MVMERLPAKHIVGTIMRSPVGHLIKSRAFEAMKLKLTAQKELPLARLGAAAGAAQGDVERFFSQPGMPRQVDAATRQRAEKDLAGFLQLEAAAQEADQAWEAAFFGDAPPTMQKRVALEAVRRKSAAALLHGGERFRYRVEVLLSLRTGQPVHLRVADQSFGLTEDARLPVPPAELMPKPNSPHLNSTYVSRSYKH